MDTTTPEPTTLVINTYPTPKEQLIAGGIALAITAGTAIALFGGLALVGIVGDQVEKRRKAKVDAAETALAEAELK